MKDKIAEMITTRTVVGKLMANILANDIDILYQKEIDKLRDAIVQVENYCAKTETSMFKLREIISSQNELIKSFGFDKCTCEKCDEYRPKIIQLKKEAGLL